MTVSHKIIFEVDDEKWAKIETRETLNVVKRVTTNRFSRLMRSSGNTGKMVTITIYDGQTVLCRKSATAGVDSADQMPWIEPIHHDKTPVKEDKDEWDII